ncbi:minor tail protein [Microbacterium phage phiMiGM15]
MLSATFEATAADLSGTWTITGVSDAIVLADALAFPDPSVADPNAQTRSNDVRTGTAEDLLRAYVSANIADTAPAERRTGFLSRLSVYAPSQGFGPTLTTSPRFDNLLELLRKIAGAGGLRFDVTQQGAGLVFTVWQPADRSAFVRMDVANDLLTSVSYGYGSPTATRAIVAGQGQGTERYLVTRTSEAAIAAETAWGRRIERFVDQRQADDPAELEQAGDALIADGGETVTGVRATPSDDSTMTYLRDWRVGDFVAVVVDGSEPRAAVTEAALKVVGPAVLFVVTLGDPSAFDAEAAADAKSISTTQRVSALERNVEFAHAASEWGAKGGPAANAGKYVTQWAKGVDSGGSVDARSEPNAIVIKTTGVYEVTYRHRAGANANTNDYICLAIGGNREAMESRADGVWDHEHATASGANNTFVTSRYIGRLTSGERVTGGHHRDTADNMIYSAATVAGTLTVRRIS